MKPIIIQLLLALFPLLPCCAQHEPEPLDKPFEQVARKFETIAEKTQFDSSEAIVLHGIVTNSSPSNSSSVYCVPGSANDELNFSLKNLSLHHDIVFDDVFVMMALKTQWAVTQTTLAPGTNATLFSFNLKDIKNRYFEIWRPGMPEKETLRQYITLDPGLYEFIWSVGVEKPSSPFSFEIR